LAHRAEDTRFGIKNAEKTFYDKRTAGSPLKALKDIDARYELLSVGLELAYFNPAKLTHDEDYQAFIYGILALY